MSLEDLYKRWTFKPIAGVQQAVQTPKDQADGTVKIVTQSTETRYNSWNFSSLPGLPATATPPNQANAEYGVNFLGDNYQSGLTPTGPGNTVVIPGTTKFKSAALNYAGTLYGNTSLRGKQGYNSNKKYLNAKGISNTPGALNSSTPNATSLEGFIGLD